MRLLLRTKVLTTLMSRCGLLYSPDYLVVWLGYLVLKQLVSCVMKHSLTHRDFIYIDKKKQIDKFFYYNLT